MAVVLTKAIVKEVWNFVFCFWRKRVKQLYNILFYFLNFEKLIDILKKLY